MDEYHTEYVEAFKLLSNRRSSGMSQNPISLVDIKSYLDLFGASDPLLLVRFIIAMDTTIMIMIEQKQKADRETK